MHGSKLNCLENLFHNHQYLNLHSPAFTQEGFWNILYIRIRFVSYIMEYIFHDIRHKLNPCNIHNKTTNSIEKISFHLCFTSFDLFASFVSSCLRQFSADFVVCFKWVRLLDWYLGLSQTKRQNLTQVHELLDWTVS